MTVTRAPKTRTISSSSTPVPGGAHLSKNPGLCLAFQSPSHLSVIQSASNPSGSLLSVSSSSSGSTALSKYLCEGPLGSGSQIEASGVSGSRCKGPLSFGSQSGDTVVLRNHCEGPLGLGSQSEAHTTVLRSHCEEPAVPRSQSEAHTTVLRSRCEEPAVPRSQSEAHTTVLRSHCKEPAVPRSQSEAHTTVHLRSHCEEPLGPGSHFEAPLALGRSHSEACSCQGPVEGDEMTTPRERLQGTGPAAEEGRTCRISSRDPSPFLGDSRGVIDRSHAFSTSAPSSMSSATPLWSSHGRSLLGWAFLWMTLQLVVLRVTPVGGQVVGENMRCHQEGEAVAVPKELFKDNPCLECVCENGIVVCNKRKCPSMEGCYWRLEAAGGSCCQECKGCIHEGRLHKHGSNWTDGCSRYECQSGVLTVSQSQCHLPCYRSLPLQERQCCQKCQGCWFEGRSVPEGETVSSRADPCIQCTCSKGNLSCEKKACPVLSCPPSRQVPVPNSCCKTCIGSRNLLSPPNGRCFLNSHLYLSGGERTIDPCTVCTCHQGYITCQRRTCPVLNCSREFQIVLENECCPTCSAAAELENVCRVPGMVRKHGEEWQLEKCMSCRCANGETSCWTISCEYGTKPCPPGFKRIETEDECCPRCEEAPGVCTVFGDPHYITFDGMLFNFQGACRYTLVRSCKGNAFSLKVNNDARRSALFSWTKSLLLTLPGMKVKLGQKLRTKVNKRRIKMKYPYSDPSGLIITREGLAMKISTPEGIKILWDGASYVEVEVPLYMHGKVCGLCGNFNRNITDDLTTYDGKMMETPDQMAMSWSIGRPKKCSVKMKKGKGLRLQRQNCPESKEGLTQCSLLNNTMFQSCHAVAPIDQFYNSCILDMCECKSSRRCECDTIQAYARHCERLGIAVPDWRKTSNCGGLECPHGAEYMECAPPCRPTCRNPNPNLDCYTRRCREGCFCPPKTVLHRGTCIPAEDCPNKGKKRHRNS